MFVEPVKFSSHTWSSRRARVMASPALRARNSRTANSRAVSVTGTPALVTAWVAGSTTRSPTSRRGGRCGGAGVEAADAIADLAAGGEHEHGRPAAALAQGAADLEAVAHR